MHVRSDRAIAESRISRGRRPDHGRLVRIAIAGFISGAVIPFLFLLALDLGLFVLGLWGVWVGTAQFEALQGQSAGSASFLAVVHNLGTLLRHFWSFRWVGIAMGGMGTLAAMVGCWAARTGRKMENTAFLTILGITTFVVNSAAMLFQERRSSLAATERLILIYYRLAKSHWAVLILGTSTAFLLALTVWELWHAIYTKLASCWNLPSFGPSEHEDIMRTLAQVPAEGWRTYQRRIHQLKLEATQLPSNPHAGPGETPTSGISQPHRWRLLVAVLLIGVLLWIPLQEAYLHVAPSVISGIVYLNPKDPAESVLLSIGPEPRSISFSSSIGQGTADFRLETEDGRVAREITGFRLMDLPGIAYNTTMMSITGLPPGTYVLHLSLGTVRDNKASEESALGKPGGVIGWSLLQGGGPWFRFLAVVMAALTALVLVDVCILSAQGIGWVRRTYS